MKTTTNSSNHSRPAFARLGKIVSAAAFGLLIGAFAIGPAQAKDHGDHDRGRVIGGGGEQRSCENDGAEKSGRRGCCARG